MSDSNDNNANKRRRSENIEDSRIVVNVGGKLFPTFRSTLTMKSIYFEKRLSGRFSDDADDSEIIVDRDHEPFSIILSYLRSGKLLISPDKLLFSSVLIEADFYGIDELVDMVRDKCYCNLNHIALDDFDEDCIDNCKAEFSTYEQIIEHVFFPSMYFEKVNYYRVISTQILPESKYVRLQKVNGTIEFIEVWQSVTYECLLTRAVQVEPLLCLAEADMPSWISIKSRTRWCTDYDSTFNRQLVPVSFWLGYNEDAYDDDWYTATKTEYKPEKGRCEYTIRIKNKPYTTRSVLAMFYNVISHSDLNHTELYGYSVFGDLMKVREFGKFMHLGPKTDADIAVGPDSSFDEDGESIGVLFDDSDDD